MIFSLASLWASDLPIRGIMLETIIPPRPIMGIGFTYQGYHVGNHDILPRPIMGIEFTYQGYHVGNHNSPSSYYGHRMYLPGVSCCESWYSLSRIIMDIEFTYQGYHVGNSAILPRPIMGLYKLYDLCITEAEAFMLHPITIAGLSWKSMLNVNSTPDCVTWDRYRLSHCRGNVCHHDT